MSIQPLLDALDIQENAARALAGDLRAQIAGLQDRLRETETHLEHLEITRKTVTALTDRLPKTHHIGRRLNNLATCARGANDWQIGSDQKSNNMKNYENQVAKAVNAGGQEVMYSVTANYIGNRTVPSSFTLTAYGTNPDGTPWLRLDEIIPNTLQKNNLGMYNHHTTGEPVPTGSTP